MKRFITAAAFASFLAAPAMAGKPILIGVGAVDGGCGSWVAAASSSRDDAVYRSWVMGYLRGAAVWSGGILHGYESLGELSVRPADPTIDSSHALLVKSYCRGHPLERVASRADGFVFEMINWKALGSAVPVPSFRATPPNANPSGLLGHGSPGGQCGSWAAGASGGLADNIFQDLAAGVERRQPVVGRNPRQLQGAG